MQRLGDGSWVMSASDLTQLSACPWLLARTVDQKLDKGVVVPTLIDPMMELVKRLGVEHEKRVLQNLRDTLPLVVEIPYDRSISGADHEAWKKNIRSAATATQEALSSPATAIFQGVFFQESLPSTAVAVGFQGFADFLVAGEDGWEVWDSKLARSAKNTALTQLAAYVDQLDTLGVQTSREVRLILGDGTHSIHDVTPLLPDYYDQRQALLNVIEERSVDPLPTPWGDPKYVACGTKSCPACSEQIELTDDLFQVSGLRKTQRQKLQVAGFNTLTDFALATRREVMANTTGVGRDTLAQLHLQASLQLATRQNPEGPPAWEVLSQGVLDTIPEPDPGDLFFDFEGDPNFQEFDAENRPLANLSMGDDTVWFGIEYLFGLWGKDLGAGPEQASFHSLWAESFAEEKAALEQFCALVEQRLEKYPNLHIYHYASYERTRLAVLAKRHTVAQKCVDRLRNGVLVDLYPVVTKGVRVGLPSYSLKSLEALYFDPGTRTGIAGGGESVAAFVDYLAALDAGDTTEATRVKDSIVHYNTIDCYSTEALRDWLLRIRARP